MKRYLKIVAMLCLLLGTYHSINACGVPQTIQGRVTEVFGGVTVGVSNAVLVLQPTNGGLAETRHTDFFGYYSFADMTACMEYQINVSFPKYRFVDPERVFYVVGDANGYVHNFIRSQ